MQIKVHNNTSGLRGESFTLQPKPIKMAYHKERDAKHYKDADHIQQTMSGELNALQIRNYYNDHSEGCHVRKCTVVRQTLCSASSAISGDAAEGGCKDIQYCIVLHFQTYVTGRSGVRTHTQVYMWSSDNEEPKHNVWLKTILIPSSYLTLNIDKFQGALQWLDTQVWLRSRERFNG